MRVNPLPPLERLRALTRVPLVGAPTPVERLERFEKAIESPYPIFIKRDDAIPFGFGGNKVRKLELVLADTLRTGSNCIITGGGVQSNLCRAAAAAAARLGLQCHVVLSGDRPKNLSGNTRLADLFGARLHFVGSRGERAPTMETLRTSLAAGGLRPAIIPLGASTSLGAAGLALAVFEMVDQGFRPDVLVHASSSGGTQAGLLAGMTLAELKLRLIGVSADESEPVLGSAVKKLTGSLLDLLGSTAPPPSPEVWDQFIGEGYGLATDASREAMKLLARSEAIVVDHTYTAKALAGLVHAVRQRAFADGSSVLFWHTGGQAAVLD